jgi:flagellar basal-body rod protein FlgB
MLIDGLVNSGEIPALEATAQFAARRHTLIAHNIANISTPRFQPRDVSPAAFQEQLGEAIDERRGRRRGGGGALELGSSREVIWERRPDGSGRIRLNPQTSGNNILFHDRNDRDLERMMQGLAENTAAFSTATQMFKSRFSLLNAAITLRP